MAQFKQAFDKLIVDEGGYVNDPDDRGGETYKGIARKFHPNWEGWSSIDSIKKHHPTTFKSVLDKTPELQDKVAKFYKERFWDVFRLDDISSQKLAEQMFNHGVNAGLTSAVKLMEKVLGLPVTGKFSTTLYNKLIE